VDAVTRVVEAVFTEPDENKEDGAKVTPSKPLRKDGSDDLWVPYWVPQGDSEGQMSAEVIEKIGRGERI
jgi:hypothetical protein